jgi:Flp pilus assembly protein TadG
MVGARIFARAFNSGLAVFARDRRGSTATMFALSLIPLVGAVGFGVDYAAANRQKALLQEALDSGALAGSQAVAQSLPNPGGVVANYVKAAFAHSPNGYPTVTVDVQPTGVVTATATLTVKNNFMKLMGHSTTHVTASSQASFNTGKLEVAIVFDTTGSMAGAKMTAAQQAANGLVDTLFALPNASTTVKVGLVPFTYYVNVGTTYAGASWLTSTAAQTGTGANWTCSTQPTYSTVLTAATCSGTSDGMPYSYDCSYYAQTSPGVCSSTPTTYSIPWYGCVGSRNAPLDDAANSDAANSINPVPALIGYGCSSPIQRLTTDSASLKAQINALAANDETYIAPGLLWGWRILSPNPPFADGAAYSITTNKSIVLMTDGANTHSAAYPDHSGSNVADANKITADTCKYIQQAGIKIYAIAFQVTDTTIKGILQNCASSVSYYYDATTISALQAAFTSIGSQMTALRLTK